MSIRRRATATTNALERAALVGAREQNRRYVGAERLRSPEIDHQVIAACRLWRLLDPAGEDGADNAGECNHRQHGDETARRESDRAQRNASAAAKKGGGVDDARTLPRLRGWQNRKREPRCRGIGQSETRA